jgi:hypothetical protein
MNRYAIIKDGLVSNIVVADSALGDGWVLLENDTISIGWSYVDGQFIQSYQPTFYSIIDESVSVNGLVVSKYAGNYYCNTGDMVQLQGTLSNGSDTPDITVPVTLKMPLVRHANGVPTNDEIYLNVTLVNGVMTASGKIERSGDWKILIERINEALQRIGADWKLQHDDVTFLA